MVPYIITAIKSLKFLGIHIIIRILQSYPLSCSSIHHFILRSILILNFADSPLCYINFRCKLLVISFFLYFLNEQIIFLSEIKLLFGNPVPFFLFSFLLCLFLCLLSGLLFLGLLFGLFFSLPLCLLFLGLSLGFLFLSLVMCYLFLRLIYEFNNNLKSAEITGGSYIFLGKNLRISCKWNFFALFTMSIRTYYHVPLVSGKDQLALLLVYGSHTLCTLICKDGEHDRTVIKAVVHLVANAHKSVILNDSTALFIDLLYKFISTSRLLFTFYSVIQLKGILKEFAVYHTNQSAILFKLTQRGSFIESIYQLFFGIYPLIHIISDSKCFLSLISKTVFNIFSHFIRQFFTDITVQRRTIWITDICRPGFGPDFFPFIIINMTVYLIEWTAHFICRVFIY